MIFFAGQISTLRCSERGGHTGVSTIVLKAEDHSTVGAKTLFRFPVRVIALHGTIRGEFTDAHRNFHS